MTEYQDWDGQWPQSNRSAHCGFRFPEKPTAIAACQELLAWWDQPNPTLGEVIKWNRQTNEYERPTQEPRYIMLAREAVQTVGRPGAGLGLTDEPRDALLRADRSTV